MAGVLRRLFGPQRELVQDRRVMELQAAKEILAEVFMARLREVDEMIQNRFEDASSEHLSQRTFLTADCLVELICLRTKCDTSSTKTVCRTFYIRTFITKAIAFHRSFTFMEMNKEDLQRIKAIEQRFKNIVTKLNSLDEIKQLCPNESLDIFSKGISWFFAISIGTLLWVLSNFDKFKVVGTFSMPYKILYVFAIICVGSSSILLAYIVGNLYWTNYRVTRVSESFSTCLKSYIKICQEQAIEMETVAKDVEQAPSPEILKSLENIDRKLLDSGKKLDDLGALFKSVCKQQFDLFQILYNSKIIIGSLVAYTLGLVLISIYIILFMCNYL